MCISNRFLIYIKKSPFLLSVAKRVSCIRTIFYYWTWCWKYSSANIFVDSLKGVSFKHSDLLSKNHESSRVDEKKLHVYFVSTSHDQDIVGIIPELKLCANISIFTDGQNKNLSFPEGRYCLKNRRLNTLNILADFDRVNECDPVDLVIFQAWSYLVDPDIVLELHKRGAKVANIAMDDRHSFHLYKYYDLEDGGTLSFAKYCDLTITCAPEAVNWYEKNSAKAIYLPEASSDRVFYPNPGVKKDIDILFIGQKYGAREKIINGISSNDRKIVCFGSGWSSGRIDSFQILDLYHRSKIVLGIGGVLNCFNFPALKMRDFDVPMSGAFYLPQYNPDLYTVYDSFCVDKITWKSVRQLNNKITFFLKNESARESVAHIMAKDAMYYHNWRNRFSVIFRMLFN